MHKAAQHAAALHEAADLLRVAKVNADAHDAAQAKVAMLTVELAEAEADATYAEHRRDGSLGLLVLAMTHHRITTLRLDHERVVATLPVYRGLWSWLRDAARGRTGFTMQSIEPLPAAGDSAGATRSALPSLRAVP